MKLTKFFDSNQLPQAQERKLSEELRQLMQHTTPAGTESRSGDVTHRQPHGAVASRRDSFEDDTAKRRVTSTSKNSESVENELQKLKREIQQNKGHSANDIQK